MDLNDVVDELSTQLQTITGLRVHSEPPGTVDPPAAVISWPEVDFDGTYGRGMDKLTLPLVLVVGKTSERIARKTINTYVNGSGTKSVKAVLEAGTYTAFDVVRVVSAAPEIDSVGGVEFLAYVFSLEIAGQGA